MLFINEFYQNKKKTENHFLLEFLLHKKLNLYFIVYFMYMIKLSKITVITLNYIKIKLNLIN
jgi:hypothetical protein